MEYGEILLTSELLADTGFLDLINGSVSYRVCPWSKKLEAIVKIIVLPVIVVLAILLPVGPIWAANRLAEKDVLGNWFLPQNGSVVQIYQCKKNVCVKVLKVADPRRRDSNNPKPELRKRPLVGIVIAENFARVRTPQDSPVLKWRGRLYNTLDGVTYDGTLNLLDKNTITLVGCVIQGLFCEAKTLYRDNPTLPGDTLARNKGNVSEDVAAFEPPPLPVRKPAKFRVVSSLNEMFDRFLDARSLETSRNFTKKERERLFNGFMAWLERQSDENRNRVTELLGY